MNHFSTFSGEGGFDLAAEWMGWNNVAHCEINPFCQTILKYYWPNAKLYKDIREINGSQYRGKVDILTGGFPCQPFSHAGKRKGSDDNRFLWPELLRIIREMQPGWFVGENVPGITTIEQGLVFKQVYTDLENAGYKVWTFNIPAAAVNGWHERKRIWFVAHRDSINGRTGTEWENREETCYSAEFDSNHQSNRVERMWTDRKQLSPISFGSQISGCNSSGEHWTQAAARLCQLDDGLSGRLDTTAISKAKWRKESIQAAGNAIVPQVAFEIFQAIQTWEMIYG